MISKRSVFWFRRDLRLKDNSGLYHALKSGQNILPLFIFDSEILNKLEDKNDLRVQFLHNEISELNKELEALGSGLLVKYGKPLEVVKQLIKEQSITQRKRSKHPRFN
jgi:deoxyribodipyrimidine photo-lyase